MSTQKFTAEALHAGHDLRKKATDLSTRRAISSIFNLLVSSVRGVFATVDQTVK